MQSLVFFIIFQLSFSIFPQQSNAWIYLIIFCADSCLIKFYTVYLPF